MGRAQWPPALAHVYILLCIPSAQLLARAPCLTSCRSVSLFRTSFLAGSGLEVPSRSLALPSRSFPLPCFPTSTASLTSTYTFANKNKMLFGVGTFSLLLAVLSTSSALPADKNCTRKLDADIGTTALVADVTASPTSVQSTQGVVLANVQAVSSSSVVSASGTSGGSETVQTASQTNTTPSSSSASSLASTSSSSSSASSDSQTFLDLHNEFRALYGQFT